jgi:hypothetical protein
MLTIFLFAFNIKLHSKEPDMVSVNISYFNVLKQKQNALESRFEYRSGLKVWELKPFAGIMMTSAGAFYAMAGFYYDIYLIDRFILTPSFASGYFHKGKGKDLNYEIEFRSQFEFSYVFDNNSRLGISFNHISNANLGNSNPGVESFAIHYSVPISGNEE